VADNDGRFHTAFTFPYEMRWIDAEWAEVIGRGSRSGFEATTRFELVAPTPTNTLPPPTPRPTLPRTQTPLPTDTPEAATATPTSTPDIIISDWLGEYFANPGVAGSPVLIRNDTAIDFNWGAGSPGPGMPNDQFSARWTRRQAFHEGFYRFTIQVDDGVRFWIDGHLLADEWHDSTAVPYTVELHLPQGERSLRLEYFENVGGAMARLAWQQIEPPTVTPSPTPTATHTPSPTATGTASSTATDTPSPTPTELPTPTPSPTDTPSPTPSPTPTDTATAPPLVRALPDVWHAAFFANSLLEDPPVLVQQVSEVSADWGDGSPDPSVPPDEFSARWVGEVWLPSGRYRYFLRVDEGARVLIDGQPVLEEWHEASGETYVVDWDLGEGSHVFLVEYFEAAGSAYIQLDGVEISASMNGR
jgi:hypothetical protein